MDFWLRVNGDSMDGLGGMEYNGTKETVDRCFNICHGLEPMNENVFEYVIKDILSTMFYGAGDYLCVAYTPTRLDRVSAVQASRPQVDEGYNTEIIINDDSKRGFNIYTQKDMTLAETISIFRKVLVEYSYPDLTSWENITDIWEHVTEIKN